jgi:hypothetical protein
MEPVELCPLQSVNKCLGKIALILSYQQSLQIFKDRILLEVVEGKIAYKIRAPQHAFRGLMTFMSQDMTVMCS